MNDSRSSLISADKMELSPYGKSLASNFDSTCHFFQSNYPLNVFVAHIDVGKRGAFLSSPFLCYSSFQKGCIAGSGLKMLYLNLLRECDLGWKAAWLSLAYAKRL